MMMITMLLMMIMIRIDGSDRFKTRGGESTTNTRCSTEKFGNSTYLWSLVSGIAYSISITGVWNLLFNIWYLISGILDISDIWYSNRVSDIWYPISKFWFPISGELDDLGCWQSDQFYSLWKDYKMLNYTFMIGSSPTVPENMTKCSSEIWYDSASFVQSD